MLGLFEDSLNEVDSPMTAKVVEGVVPPWLNGSLFRVGPSQFSSPGRNVTHMFDGLASVHRWVFVQGAVSFQSRFLRSAVFKATRASGKFPKSRTIGPVEPPFGLFEATCADDNTNVNVFQEAGPNGSLLVLTDTTVTNAVDPGSLATEGTIKHSDQLWDALLSPAHPHRDAADGSFLGVAAFANLLGPSKLWVFRMGSDRKRVPFGAVTLQFAPYMHSFALTEHYAVVALFPAHLNLGRVIAYDPLSSAFEWKGDELNTTILVFDRRKTDSAPPVATFSAPPFFAFHHANAYEDGEQLVLDMCAYPDMSLMTDPHSFGYLSVVRNATARAAASPRPWLRRLRLDLGRGGAAVGVEDMQATDTNGTVYWFDFPKVNPTRDGKPYCFVYGAAFRASGTSAIVKMDVCEATQAGARGTTPSLAVQKRRPPPTRTPTLL